MFLAADESGVDHAVDEARRYLAVSRIIGDVQRLSQYSKEQQKRLKELAKQAELTLRVAITRLYRRLFYPDAAASARDHRLSRFSLPAQDQGDVDRDQTQVVLRALRELGKVRTADDSGVAPAYARQKAWPANADRITTRQLRKEFSSRVGLPILLDVNLLKETIRLGIKAGQWLYFDPQKQCAYSAESPTSPLVEITDEVELILPEAAEGVPVCGKAVPEEETAAPAACPVCRNPQDACICAGKAVAAHGRIEGSGSPARAFKRVADLAQDREIDRLAGLEVSAGGADREFGRDLQAMALAVPQLPRADVRVTVKGAFDLPGGDRLSLEFEGAWQRYRQINDAVLKAAKDASAGSGRITVHLDFPSPVDPVGSEIGSIRDTFTRIDPGEVSVTAVPPPESS